MVRVTPCLPFMTHGHVVHALLYVTRLTREVFLHGRGMVLEDLGVYQLSNLRRGTAGNIHPCGGQVRASRRNKIAV